MDNQQQYYVIHQVSYKLNSKLMQSICLPPELVATALPVYLPCNAWEGVNILMRYSIANKIYSRSCRWNFILKFHIVGSLGQRTGQSCFSATQIIRIIDHRDREAQEVVL